MAYTAPLTANTANSVILEDSWSRTVVKLWGFTSAGDAEGSVLKVNAAALVGACVDLTFNVAQYHTITQQYGFVPGELITGAGGATAYVVSYTANTTANSTLRVVYDPSTSNTFGDTEQITGSRLGTVVTLNDVVTPWYQLNIESIWHSITSKNGEGVALEFAGANSTFETVVLLHGEGYLGKNSSIPTVLRNPQSASDPNIYLTTYNFAAKSSYMIVLEIGKTSGYGYPAAG
jgi:hypothetical protein